MKKINFLKHMYLFFGVSAAAVILSIVLIFTKGFNYGIDFTGGIEITATFDKPELSAQTLKDELTAKGVSVSIQPLVYEKPRFFMHFAVKEDANMLEEQKRLTAILNELYPNIVSVESINTIGSVMSKQNQNKIIWAIFWSCLGIVLYMSMRFTYQYGVSAVVALLHDLLIMSLFIILFDKEFSIFTITAFLTILGYSINDTIVVFDRIREFRKRKEHNDLKSCINDSLNSTLKRTIITSLLTFTVVVSLYIFSQGDLEDLSFSLMVGIIAGTYSSVYVASVLLIIMDKVKPVE